MPFVLVDTSVSLPATLSPGGFRRRFFVILAFGAVTYEVGHRKLELDELVKEAVRQVEALCMAGSPPFDPSTSPALTRDPHDDPIVYSALLADADLLISDDRDIVPDGIEQFYEHGDRSTTAMTFNRMIERYFPAAEVDFSEIDGSWLGLAYSAMAADAARHTGRGVLASA